MAWIGKNGKDGSDGKEDCSRIAGLAAVFGGAAPLPLAVSRVFIKVVLTQIGQIPPALRVQSNQYWDQISNFGLADSYFTSPAGDTTLVLSVASQQEAQSLVTNDPIVMAGLVGNISYSQL